MYLKVRRDQSTYVLGFWGYGDQPKSLLAGSGLRVGEDGVVYNHHFLPLKGQSGLQFEPGSYVVEVYASVVGKRSAVRLYTLRLSLSNDDAEVLSDKANVILYSLEPETREYRASVMSQ